MGSAIHPMKRKNRVLEVSTIKAMQANKEIRGKGLNIVTRSKNATLLSPYTVELCPQKNELFRKKGGRIFHQKDQNPPTAPL